MQVNVGLIEYSGPGEYDPLVRAKLDRNRWLNFPAIETNTCFAPSIDDDDHPPPPPPLPLSPSPLSSPPPPRVIMLDELPELGEAAVVARMRAMSGDAAVLADRCQTLADRLDPRPPFHDVTDMYRQAPPAPPPQAESMRVGGDSIFEFTRGDECSNVEVATEILEELA
jgi:hypothetical protein